MKIVIVGLGVIGGSFALALKQAGYEMCIRDSRNRADGAA